MILLTVLSYNGAPAKGPAASFDELGGTIGRADHNQLVLPDPERSISRVHAKVVFRSGGFAIVDNGSNPISVNGVALGSGREQPLKLGDEVQIGGYVLKAGPATAATAPDPFADLFGDVGTGLAVPPPAPASMVSVTRTWAPASGTAWPAASTAAPPAAPPSATLQPGHIPDDWDPFGAEVPAAQAASPLAAAPASASNGGFEGFGAAPGRADSLDDLFGLSATPLQGDPLGAAPAQAFGQAPNTATDHDPLLSLGRTAGQALPATAASEGFAGSELNTPMPLKRALPGGAQPPSSAGVAALPAGAIFSWDEPPRDGKVVTLPGAPRPPATPATPVSPATPTAAPAVPAPSAPPLQPPLATGPAAAAAVAVMAGVQYPPPAPFEATRGRLPADTGPAAHAQPDGLDFDLSATTGLPASAQGGEDHAALLAALMRGLAVPGLRWEGLTPARMELLGQLLRESTRGAVELLVARAALKREMRAEMTMIVARENNPLKFSPSVEVALQHLLGEPAPGFMAPAPAMRDAFDDVRAHQLGVMAGMKAAMEGVVQRFDPTQLEGKLTRQSAIASLIPATRKARLWELFQELFGQISAEAQDDFQELFGRAFVRAYEAQLDRLAQEPGPR